MLNIQIKKKQFDTGLTLFENLSIRFPKNGVIAFYGPSGCGKTTLAKMIASMDNDYDGTIQGNKRVVYISDHVHLFDELTVNDHLKMVQTDQQWMDHPLDAFGLSNEANKKASVLSIGQRKRLALLMALQRNATILILDEISSGLDQKIRDQIMMNVRHYARSHLVIWISHDEYEMDHYMDGIIDFMVQPLHIRTCQIHDDPAEPIDYHPILHPWTYIKSKRIQLTILTFMSILLVFSSTLCASLILTSDRTSELYDAYDHGSTMIMSYPLHNDPIEGQLNFYYDYPVFEGDELMQWMEDDPSLWGIVARTSNEYEFYHTLTVDGQTIVDRPFGDRLMSSIYQTFYHEEYELDAPNYPWDAPFVLEKSLDHYRGVDFIDKAATGYTGQDHLRRNQVDIIHLNPRLETLPLHYGNMPITDDEVVIDQKLADFLIVNGYATDITSLIGSSFPIYMYAYQHHSSLIRGVTKENYDTLVNSRHSQATMEMVKISGILEYPLGDHYALFTNTPVGMDPLSSHYYYDTTSAVFPEIMLFYDPTIEIQEKLDQWNQWLDHDGGVFVTMDQDHVNMQQDYRNSTVVWIMSLVGSISLFILIIIAYRFFKKRLRNDALLLKNLRYSLKKIQWLWTMVIMVPTTLIIVCGFIIARMTGMIPLNALWITLGSLIILWLNHSLLIHCFMQS